MLPVSFRGYTFLLRIWAFSRPPNEAVLIDLRAKDGRSAKEWEYINAVGVLLEVAMCLLEILRAGQDDPQAFATKLGLGESGCAVKMEFLSMCAQYFKHIVNFVI